MAKFTSTAFPSLVVKFDSRTRVRFERGEVEVSGDAAERLADFADRHPAYGIEQVEGDKAQTPKQRAVAEAEARGLDTSGTQADIEARIAAHEAAEDDEDADEADNEDADDDSDEDDSENP